MTEAEFNELADSTLARIETAIDNHGNDAECNRSGNVLEIEFENGEKIIVNRHDVNREIWVAAKSGGFHYAWRENGWRSRRDAGELFNKLNELLSAQGEHITF
ncbi:MAG: iron donor protein CyaY [Pseudomonadota bacterium]